MIEKFCSGCRRWKPEHLIESKRVTVFRHGKATHYRCVPCAEKARERIAKSRAAEA